MNAIKNTQNPHSPKQPSLLIALWAFGVSRCPGLVVYLHEVVFDYSPSDHEIWSIWCHVGLHVDFTIHLAVTHSSGPSSVVWSHLELAPPPFPSMRATSNARLRATDHYTSSILIGGKGGAGPNSLHIVLEGPKEYVNARWMWSPHGFLHGIGWIMFHGHLDDFQKPPLGGRPTTKPGDHGTPNAHHRRCILIYYVWRPIRITIQQNSMRSRARSHATSHYTWGPMTTQCGFGGVLGHPLDTFNWALTISWSWLLACMWSGLESAWSVMVTGS